MNVDQPRPQQTSVTAVEGAAARQIGDGHCLTATVLSTTVIQLGRQSSPVLRTHFSPTPSLRVVEEQTPAAD